MGRRDDGHLLLSNELSIRTVSRHLLQLLLVHNVLHILLIHVNVVLFFVHGSAAIEQLIKYRIKLPGHSVLHVCAMYRVLLHLVENASLENVAKEALMSFLQALEVILKGFSLCLENLYFAKSQCSVQAIAYLI